MQQSDIIKNFKFFHGESKCPYPDKTPEASLWKAEARFNEIVSEPRRIPTQVERLKDFNNLIDKRLKDDAQKVVYLYVSLWIAKHTSYPDSIMESWIKA